MSGRDNFDLARSKASVFKFEKPLSKIIPFIDFNENGLLKYNKLVTAPILNLYILNICIYIHIYLDLDIDIYIYTYI